MIFYFTGTGNSLFAVKKTAEKTGDRITDMSEAIRNKNMSFRINTEESIGFVFPVYYSGLPHIVAKFIKEVNLVAEDDCYTYAIITCGASSAGADTQLKKLLKEKTMHIDYVAQLKMPDNYVMLYDPADKKRSAEMITAATSELTKIADDISSKKTGGWSSGFVGGLANSFMQPMYNMLRKTKKFFADGNCVSCGMCEKICPVAAIKMENGKPHWVKEKCEHCTACINGCPQRAIQYGSKTKNRTRFVNDVLK